MPAFLYAGVILKKSGERLEDVSIQSVTDTDVVYLENGSEQSISKNEVAAILYDDGRYEEIKESTPNTAIPTETATGNNSSSESVNVRQKAGEPAKDIASREKKRIPKACFDEGQKVYSETFAEARAKALSQGYSNSQAYTIASEEAFQAKQKAIDDCYNSRVLQE